MTGEYNHNSTWKMEEERLRWTRCQSGQWCNLYGGDWYSAFVQKSKNKANGPAPPIVAEKLEGAVPSSTEA